MNIARTLTAAVVLAAPLALAGMSSASAHTPVAEADCDGLTFQVSAYRAEADNTLTVKIDGAVVSGWDHKEFGSSARGSADIPADSGEHTWSVSVHTSEDESGSRGWSRELTGTVGPCAEEPTPSETPTTTPAETPSETPTSSTTTSPEPSQTPSTTEAATETPTPSTTETVSGPPVQTDQVAGDGTGLVPVAALGAFAVVSGAGAVVARRRTRR